MKINTDNLTETELEVLIKRHDKLYWEEFTFEISDIDYDLLVRKLTAINPINPILTQLHQSVRGKHKIPFKEPLLSLNKVYSITELVTWCEKVAKSDSEVFVIQPKYDGVSVDFNGKILVTTSDSNYGIDISSRIKYINNIGNTPIRGEVVITKSDFQNNVLGKLKKSNGKDFKNTRNAAAGLLNRDSPISGPKVLTIIPFSEIGFEMTLDDFKTDTTKLKEAEDYVKNILDSPVDGLVIKLKDEQYGKSLGNTSHHPRGQVALKFETINIESTLISVTWQVGKVTITPVGNIVPIDINNTTVKNVNLHNAKYILDRDLHIGDKVFIEKSGEIIPNLIRSEPGVSRTVIQINECPMCGHNVEYKPPELICTNIDCTGKLSRKLYDAVKRLGIETLGLSTIGKMIEQFGIEDIIGIFELTIEDLLELDGFANLSAENLFDEIQKIKIIPIEEYKILASLNIKGIGSSLSKSILQKVTLSKLLQMTPEDLEEMPQIGTGRSFEIYLGIDENTEIINYLRETLNIIPTDDKKKSICFTGKATKSKSFYKKIAERNGFEIAKRITKDLTLLVTANLSSSSNKMKTAQSLNINIIDIEQFMSLKWTK